MNIRHKAFIKDNMWINQNITATNHISIYLALLLFFNEKTAKVTNKCNEF